MKNTEEIVRYILQFLLRTDDEKVIRQIGYTSDREEMKKYRLVILPSLFFNENFYGTPDSFPDEIVYVQSDKRKIPVLYGDNGIEMIDNTTIIHADLIASTFFFISRYEETIRPETRDVFGRFIGKESIAYKNGFLQRPIVDEYGDLLRDWMRKYGLFPEKPVDRIDSIYLTTDVDKLAHFRNFKSTAKAVAQFPIMPHKAFKALRTYFGSIYADPWFTFPLFFNYTSELKNSVSDVSIKSIAFIKSGGNNCYEDQPLQRVESNDFKLFFDLCRKNEVEIGLHPSFQAGMQPNLIRQEKSRLEKAIGQKVYLSRNHYLCNREPHDFNALIKAGLTDDFTMSYADVAGFRLGTCRPVRWIDPENMKLTSLTLHPLTVMDNTLSDVRYMNLKEEEAFDYCKKLIDEIKARNGELVLLWHNISLEKNNQSYLSELYPKIIHYLRENAE